MVGSIENAWMAELLRVHACFLSVPMTIKVDWLASLLCPRCHSRTLLRNPRCDAHRSTSCDSSESEDLVEAPHQTIINVPNLKNLAAAASHPSHLFYPPVTLPSMPHEVLLPDDGRPASTPTSPKRRQSSHSVYARTALMSSKLALSAKEHNGKFVTTDEAIHLPSLSRPPPPPSMMPNGVNGLDIHADLKPIPGRQSARNGVGIAASDTPFPSAPSSPKLSVNFPILHNSMPDAYTCPDPP